MSTKVSKPAIDCLTLKFITIDTYREYVAYLNRCSGYRIGDSAHLPTAFVDN